MNIKVFISYLIAVLVIARSIYAQAEKPAIFYDYYKINENAPKIKSSKIQKATTVLASNEVEDTVNIAFYDANGYLIENNSLYKIISNGEMKNIYLKNTYLYDEYGKLISKTDTSASSYKKISLSYEDNGNLEEELVLDSKGTKIKRISHEYDDLARLIESVEKDLPGDCKVTKKYAYDSYSNMAKYSMNNTCKDADINSLDISYVYKYDKQGNILEKNTLYPAGGYRTEQFTYSVNGLLTQNYVITGTDIYTVFLYTYDKNNTISKVERTEVSGLERKKYSQVFKYDKNGNILEKQELSEDGKLIYKNKYYYEFY